MDTKEKSVSKTRRVVREKGIDVASLYLEHHGFKIKERKWIGKAGSIDLIRQDEYELVFIEVISHAADESGLPEEAVTFKERQRYKRIALEYLFSRDLPSTRVRFDVVALVLDGEYKAFVRHHRDAFSVEVGVEYREEGMPVTEMISKPSW